MNSDLKYYCADDMLTPTFTDEPIKHWYTLAPDGSAKLKSELANRHKTYHALTKAEQDRIRIKSWLDGVLLKKPDQIGIMLWQHETKSGKCEQILIDIDMVDLYPELMKGNKKCGQ
jgi:hypothetical protein